MMLALSLLALVAAIGLVIALTALSWSKTPTPAPTPDVPAVVFDFCEVCGDPATHELAGSFGGDGDQGRIETMAMIACYCAEDAPEDAVKVR